MPFDAEYATHLTRDPLTITEPRERLEYLRDFLRALPAERFSMRDWHCGTAACIGGWAEQIFFGQFAADDKLNRHLGLSEAQHDLLFYPHGAFLPDGRMAFDASHAQAADVLDHLLKTGEVDWSVAAVGPQVVG